MHDHSQFDPRLLDDGQLDDDMRPLPGSGLWGALLPSSLEGLAARAGGWVTLLAVTFAGIALVTWSATDPSLTHATDGTPANWMGFPGASFADIAMQLLGLATAPALVFPAVWGWRRIKGGRVRGFTVRLGLAGASLACTAAALGCLGVADGWPLRSIGMGGVVGDAVLSVPKAFVGVYPSGVLGLLVAGAFAMPAAWFAMLALRLPKAPKPVREAEAEPVDAFAPRQRPGLGARVANTFAAPIGLVTHLVYSARAHARRRVAHSLRTARDAGREAGRTAPVMGEDVETPTLAPFDVVDEPQIIDIQATGSDGAVFEAEATTIRNQEIAPVESGLKAAMRRAASVPRVAVPEDDMEDVSSVFGTDDDGWQTEQPDPIDVANFAAADAPAARPVTQVVERVTVATPAAPKPAAAPTQSRRVVAEPPQGAPETFALPGLELLAPPKRLVEDPALSSAALEENARRLEGVLGDFGVKGSIIKVRPGPVVTLYELEPAPGIKSSRVIGLADDIARSMEAIAARVAVVPGRNAIGIELPNHNRETVFLSEMLKSDTFNRSKAKLAITLGKTIGGEPVVADLAKMPHLLVAGTTGSGKSVAINTIILSLLYKHGPDACRLIMVDPKMVELSVYDGIPHLLTPVVTDPKKAVVALKWIVREMEQRYQKMSKVGVRNVDGFNTRVRDAQAKGEVITRTVQTGFDRETGEAIYEHEEFDLEPMPYIVVIIDEVADLMMVAGKEIEGAVQRLGQMARAAGIHVIMATQRPSTDVITGTIKANFPTRISFQVTSKIDSRVMLGEAGAEQLLGMGDMLHMAGGGRIERVHGPFVDDSEVEGIVDHLKLQGVPDYLDDITADEDEEGEDDDKPVSAVGDLSDSDDPYDQAVAVVLRDRKVSTSYIQRRLGIGYNRSASLIERMEEEGIIGPANHAGKRDILIPAEDETI